MQLDKLIDFCKYEFPEKLSTFPQASVSVENRYF